jgi:hypothetical protein
MMRRLAVVAVGLVLLAAVGRAAEPQMEHGTITKASSKALTFEPRGTAGRFGKAVTLKVTGTSEVSTLRERKVGKKVVLVQEKTEVGALKKGQAIWVIYAGAKNDKVLLTAVVTPAK